MAEAHRPRSAAPQVWFTCKEASSGGDGIDCSADTDFGVGGGPGILPQDGEVLCVQKKPQEALEEDQQEQGLLLGVLGLLGAGLAVGSFAQ